MALPVSETFTGTDFTTLQAHNSNWTALSGSIVLYNNAARGAASGGESYYLWNGDAFETDQYVQGRALYSGYADWGYPGLLCRATDANNYYLVNWATNDKIYLTRRAGGISADIGTANKPEHGQMVRLECEGSNIRVLVDGETVISVTDSALSAGAAGIYFYSNLEALIDDWEAGNLASAPVTHDLTATAISSPGAVIGSAVLGQRHGLAAETLALTVGQVGSSTLKQTHALAAETVMAESAALETPALTAVAGVDDLMAVGIELTAQIGSAALEQTHRLAVLAVDASAAEMSTPDLQAVAGVNDLAANDLAGPVVIGQPVIMQTQVLVAALIVAASGELGTPEIGQRHALTAGYLVSGEWVIGNPTMRKSGVVTPAERTILVRADKRIYSIGAENRAIRIQPENRTILLERS
jgi:hypothetical protein